MRIGLVTQPGHAVLPAAGSIELWADAVARRLADRHEITLYASRPPTTPARPDETISYRLVAHKRGRFLIRGLRFAWRLLPSTRPFFASVFHPIEYWLRVAFDIRRRRLDVVHIFNYSQVLPILRRLTGAKLVLHMHCEWLTQLDARMIDRRLRHADLIVGCSDYITDGIRERFPQHAARCTTIYNGVAERTRDPDDGGRADGSIRLLNVGRVSPEKGLHVLVDALERLIPRYPDVRLTIVGEESPVPYEFAVKMSKDPLVADLARFYDRSYLDALRARMTPAVAERVTFVSRVLHDQALRYYDDADIFVYPSIFESFAIPPVEAMAAGLAVVASRVGGMRETIIHEQTGLLVERDDPDALADAIERLIQDPELRRSFGEAGAARATRFSWARITSDVEAAFCALVRQSPADATAPVNVIGPS